MRLAVFDFDGTIYQGETIRLFLRVLARRDRRMRRAVRFYTARSVPGYLAYKLGLWRLDMMTLAARGLVGLMRGMDRHEMEEFFRQCAEEAAPRFNPLVLARLEAHLAAGDRGVILSGAYAPFLAAVAARLGAGAWIGTEILMEETRCAGMGRHIIGPRKVEALRSYLAEEERTGTRFDLSEAFVYADGIQDLPLLLMAGHPVAVNPDSRLRREAARRGGEVI
ncbi:MAG: HAD-IB family hydrolase [Firmicutes bacterium]|nr:HAD-IB family hydrolase [Bacillota bacterium]